MAPDVPSPDPEADAGWAEGPDRTAGEPALMVDVEGFEGPLDLLLALARTQKVDLSRISILGLVDQYLSFVEAMRRLRLELAADYLVMAAWLAYLKSRLLIPRPPSVEGEPTAEEMAEELAERLRRLEEIRAAGARLAARPRLGRDVFARGAPEPVAVALAPAFHATLHDLVAAYAAQRQRQMISVVHVRRRTVWSLADAREILARLVGSLADWVPIETFLAPYLSTEERRATVRASSFSAMLELVREGRMEVRQASAFAPLFVRAGPGHPGGPEEDGDR